MKVKIKRKPNGGVLEVMRGSYTYWVAKKDAEILNDAAGLIAQDVRVLNKGFEFLLRGMTETEAKKVVKEHNGVDIGFFGKGVPS